jgi:hypothetical protein
MVFPAPEMLIMAQTFLRTALRLSIWDPAGEAYWAPLEDVQKHLLFLQEHLPHMNQVLPKEDVVRYQHYLLDGFRRAANLGRMYEELVREWRMPTFLATLTDYHVGNKYNPPEHPGARASELESS